MAADNFDGAMKKAHAIALDEGDRVLHKPGGGMSEHNVTHWVQCAASRDACPIFPDDTRIKIVYVEELPESEKTGPSNLNWLKPRIDPKREPTVVETTDRRSLFDPYLLPHQLEFLHELANKA